MAIVLGADARLSCILATVLKPGLIEFADRVAVAGAKRNVRPISWLGPPAVTGPFKAERSIRQAVSDPEGKSGEFCRSGP